MDRLKKIEEAIRKNQIELTILKSSLMDSNEVDYKSVLNHPAVKRWVDKGGNSENLLEQFAALDDPDHFKYQLGAWQETRGGSFVHHIIKTFGLKYENSYEGDHLKEFWDKPKYNKYTDNYRQYYAYTQKNLKEIDDEDTVRLFRGLGVGTTNKLKKSGLKIGDEFDLKTWNVSSWSSSKSQARSFAIHKPIGEITDTAPWDSPGVILEAEIPKEKVFMHTDVSWSHIPSEWVRKMGEAIVVGTKHRAKVHDYWLGKDSGAWESGYDKDEWEKA